MTRKRKVLLIIFTILFAITVGVIFHFSQQAYEKIDRDSQILYSTIALSSIGLVILAIRERKGIDRNYVEALEVLILVIIPTTDAIYLFKNPINNLTWALVPYFVVIISWFIFFIWRIDKKSKIKDSNILNRELLTEIDEKKKRKTVVSIAILWCLLMVYGVTAVWLSVQVIPLFSHQSS